MKNIYIFIFLNLVSINQISSYKCGFYDELKNEPPLIDDQKVFIKTRRTAESVFTKIKIKVDFSSLKKLGIVTDQTLKTCKKLVDEAITDYGKILKFKHEDASIKDIDIIKKNCGVNDIDSNWQNFFTNYDIVIFPYFYDGLSSSVLASACRCLSNGKRTYAGYLKINPKISFSKKNIETYFKQIVIHEFTHVLIFSPSIFDAFGMLKRSGNDYTNSSIISPLALKEARKHFNCPSLSSIPLEDQGGQGTAGGHWESRYMLGDFMIGSEYVDNVISDITLALFNDTGMYQAMPYSGGLFKYGKNKGCNFFNKKCIEVVGGKRVSSFTDEFCTDYDKEICSTSRISKGKCIVVNFVNVITPSKYRYYETSKKGGRFKYVNYCPISILTEADTEKDYLPTSCNLGTATNYGEVMGDNSFCFMSSLLPSNNAGTASIKPTCYKVECDSKNKNIIVYVNNNKVKCPTNGGSQSLDGFKGTIECPKYTDICNTVNPNKLCNTLFNCLSSKSYALKSKIDESSYTYLDDKGNNGNKNESENKPGKGNTNLLKKNSSNNLKYNFYYIISLLIF